MTPLKKLTCRFFDGLCALCVPWTCVVAILLTTVFLSTGQAVAEPRKALTIDWVAASAAAERDTKTQNSLLNKLRSGPGNDDELRDIELPVLVAGKGPVRSSPTVRGQRVAYSSSYALNGASVAILGSATVLVHPDLPSAHNAAAGFSPEFEITEDGADLNFNRFGANYILRISCRRADDERCTKPDFLNSLKESLIVIGGQPKNLKEKRQ